MSEDQELYIEGEPFDIPILKGSLPQFILDKWRTHNPNKILLIDNASGEKCTSQELLHRSLRLAKSLQNMGLKPGGAVSLFGKSSINICVAAYGTLLAGGVIAPIDPNLKQYELGQLLKNQQSKFIFIEKECEERYDGACKEMGLELKTISLDANVKSHTTVEDLLKVSVDYDSYQPPPVNDPDNDVVVLIPSSGTTGLPKIVAIPHNAALYSLMMWTHLNENTTYLQITQFYWVGAINQWLNSICNEFCRVLIREFNPEIICQAVEKYKTEWVVITPPDMLAWMRHPNFDKYDRSSMKLLGLAGTSPPDTLLDLLRDEWKHPVRYAQGFGATELFGPTTNIAPVEFVQSAGIPLPGIQFKVLDTITGKSLPADEVGEVCMRGPTMMKGYLGNEEATRAALDKDGWYHTGDAGYYTKDKYIYITGRYKEIFKYRATHISPKDLEDVILRLAGVKDVGVAAVPHPEEVNLPMALVVKEPNSNLTTEDVVAHVADKMTAARRLAGGARFVDEIPRTNSGKIKRIELNETAARLYNSV